MPYRVVLITKSGERETHDAWTSPRRTPEIGEVIEISIKTRVVRALVKGIARASADGLEGDESCDLVIAREI
jgi:hypothetical protein